MIIPHSQTTLLKEDWRAVLACLDSGFINKGNLNIRFENKLADFLGMNHVRLTSSGTMAWMKILLALDVCEGDEILLPDYICNSLLFPVQVLKARPVLYDNSNDSWSSGVNEILANCTKKTKVILINHVFGAIHNTLPELKKKLRKEIYIVEDCCHAFAEGSMIDHIRISKHSICSFYSFNATKLLACGEGGAIASNDQGLIGILDNYEIGDNLSDMSCSLGLSQLKKYPDFIKKRQDISLYYLNNISEDLTVKTKKLNSIWFRFPVWTHSQNIFLKDKKIAFRKGVDSLLSFSLKKKPLKNAFDSLMHTISIPIFPSLTPKDLKTIINRTNEIYDTCRIA